jgi:hypothetical protein
MKKLILVTLSLILTTHVFAQANMRKCTLLPITDSVGGAISYKVFEKVENYLKESKWCLYKTNSEIITILNNYKTNLATHLENKEVLKVFAEKLNVGSLIKVKIQSKEEGVDLHLSVIGSNGEDVYYKDKKELESDDIDEISNSINTWLESYAETIPYDGRVSGVLGDQVTIDIGKKFALQEGTPFVVKRPQSKRKHPLLQEIVEFDTLVIGRGKISNVSETQALGHMNNYETEKKVNLGDWIKLEKEKMINQTPKFEEKKFDFGKLGIASIYLNMAKGSGTSASGATTKKIGGMLLGLNLKAELWVTRNYFGLFEYGKRIGDYSKKTNNTSQDSYNVSMSNFKLAGGYKYLPVGFFYGPQVDLYGGYARYSFGVDNVLADGFGESKLHGLLAGVGANMPFMRDYRAFARFEALPWGKFTEENKAHGDSSSIRSYMIEMGCKYYVSTIMSLDGSMQMVSNKGKFKATDSEVTYQDTIINGGLSYSF